MMGPFSAPYPADSPCPSTGRILDAQTEARSFGDDAGLRTPAETKTRGLLGQRPRLVDASGE